VPFDVSGVITYAVIDHPNQAVVLDFVEFDRDGTGRACSRTFTRASRTVLSRVCCRAIPEPEEGGSALRHYLNRGRQTYLS
jgi:hypothetical protein